MRSNKVYVHKRNVGGSVISEKRIIGKSGMPISIRKMYDNGSRQLDYLMTPVISPDDPYIKDAPIFKTLPVRAEGKTVKGPLPIAVLGPDLPTSNMSTQDRIAKAFDQMTLKGSGHSKPQPRPKQSGTGIRFL